MEMDTTQVTLHTAFWVALLLDGLATTAEAAVLEGISACEGVSHRGLLIESVRAAIRGRGKSVVPDGPELLPLELRRLFVLQPLLRECFVLRILAGLSPGICADLLGISISDFEDALYTALTQLPLVSSQHIWPIR